VAADQLREAVKESGETVPYPKADVRRPARDRVHGEQAAEYRRK
jgi:hypothetical protein